METTPTVGRHSTPEETSQVAQACYLRSARKLSRQDNESLSAALTNLAHRIATESWPGEGGDAELTKVLSKLFKKYSRANLKPAPLSNQHKKKGGRR